MSEQLNRLIENFSNNNLSDFFRRKQGSFIPDDDDLSYLLKPGDDFSLLNKIGEVKYDNADELLVFSCKYDGELTSRSSRKRQFDIAKKALNQDFKDGAVFVFYDTEGRFRFSFIRKNYGIKGQNYSNWKRFTYFIDPHKPNKTFRVQMNKCDFSSLEVINKAFSIDAVTNEFYNNFKPQFDKIANSIQSNVDFGIKQDFTLLFVIRIIFIGFVQKRKWLGDDEEFLQNFWNEYKSQFMGKNEFFSRWIEPLFFEALNSTPGRIVAYQNNEFSKETRKALNMAPFLNGEIFNRKDKIDNIGLKISDAIIEEFFDFLFQYNFTIEENTRFDEDLELNPEFLGIIFERLVNKEDGAVYTPRTEVDFMCRISLVKWLQKVANVDIKDLYHLFFRERGYTEADEDFQKHGDFSKAELRELIPLLQNVAICDPASGSGAFPVGMMQVLNEILENLQCRPHTPEELKNEDAFDRKKAIIANSLYGVEVKRWAVWINQLRLWLSLFVDIPTERDDELRFSPTPLLPNLDFKIRCGDSLVQRIGDKLFSVRGRNMGISMSMKRKITALKKEKIEFFYNRSGSARDIKHKESSIFREIIYDQINERQKEIRALKRPKAEQTKLFGNSPKQANLEFDAERINQLIAEINNLKNEEAAFNDEHPLIWTIEFSEVFYEKKGFDIIIGNPPYVRREDINDPNSLLTSNKYKELLQKTVREEYPRYFGRNEPIDGKSDLYIYFYLKTLALLNENGIHTFICSNSWLDVGYGAFMQKFLLHYCKVHFIIDNQAKRVFANADINTNISVIDAPVSNQNNLSSTLNYKFIAFKKPNEQVFFSENLLEIELETGQFANNPFYRIFSTSIGKLLEEGGEKTDELSTSKYLGNKWGGKYLKAPEFFLNIYNSNRVRNIDEFVEIKYGLKTGKVGFFYIDISNPYDIEAEYLFPAVISSQHFSKIVIEPTHYIFQCSKSKEQLKGTNALTYIKWGEQNNMHTGRSVEAHKPYWYSLDCPPIETIFFQFWDKRFFTPFSKSLLTCSNNFCYGEINQNINSVRLLVNSTFYYLQIELFGLNSQGQGVLTTYKEYDYPFIRLPFLNPNEFLYETILDELSQRDIGTVFQECGINPESETPIEEQEPKPPKDRKQLDEVVFAALELSEVEQKEVYRTICKLVWNRITRANSVNN